MAKQIISIGTLANDGTGDPLRTAYTKANENFTENYDSIADLEQDVDDTNTALNDKADLVAGKVPTSQLPAYVDDVIEVANFAALPGTGVAGVIYITLDDNHTFRWATTVYVDLGSEAGVTLGETSGTAYRGDRGKIGYDFAVAHNLVDNTADTGKPVSTAQQTALDLKAPLANPTFTGVPAGPTAANLTNTAQFATTAFVQQEIGTAPVVSVAVATTLSATAFGKLHICTAVANYTIDLPTAVGNANKTIIFKGDAALTKNITLAGVSGQLIDGEANRSFSAGGSFTLLSDGANWVIINEVGSWVTYTPVWTGFSADPTVAAAEYFRVGKLCTIRITTSATGTSNATTTTVTAPFIAATTNLQYGFIPVIANNSISLTAPGLVQTRQTSSNVLDLFITQASGAWTSANGKRVSFTFTYHLL